jgi:Asp-tRNA(Asn)/Glu-tRNA(Gln) amidotransferase A subunit family amidase
MSYRPAALHSSLPLPYRLGSHALPSFVSCVAAFREGRDSPREYLEHCITNITALEPQLQAFVHLDLEAARRSADAAGERYRAGRPLSPIDGMPVGVKDIIDTRDMPTQMNSPIFKGFQPRRDAACVVALRDAGAVIVGKTVTTEFASARSGPTHNPFDPARTPGGSSSGSAAAVAAGLLPGGLGTQTLGSILRPSSYCGVFGWKPTHGTVSLEGVAPLSRTLDHVGVITATIEDGWALMMAMANRIAPSDWVRGAPPAPPAARKPARLAKLETAGWTEIDAAAKRAFEEALKALTHAGVEIVDRRDATADPFERQLLHASEVAMSVFAWESQWPMRAYEMTGRDLLGDRLHELLDQASRMTVHDYEAALQRRAELIQSVQEIGLQVDGFVTLAASGPASLGLKETGSRTFPTAWSLLGAPSCSLPVLSVDGLPLGLQLMDVAGRDARMIATARWMMECLLPGAAGQNS